MVNRRSAQGMQALLESFQRRRQAIPVPSAERVWRRRNDDNVTQQLFDLLSSPGGEEEALELLFRFPELSRKRDSYGRLPIHVAALKGHLEVVESLLEVDRGFASSTSSSTTSSIAMQSDSTRSKVSLINLIFWLN